MKRLLVFFVLFLLMSLFSADVAAQCAMCKEAAATSLKNDPTSMARSLNKGILYLMAVPYLMMAFIFRRQLYKVYKMLAARLRPKQS